MAEKTLKCYGCKQLFPKNELISYAPPLCTVYHNYCPSCYDERVARDKFSTKVCEIFGLKSPGPRIWTERVRLMEQGFTDAMICECLDYIYHVKKMKKLSESLYLINTSTYQEMQRYKILHSLPEKESVTAVQMFENRQTYYMKPKETPTHNVKELDPNDFLDD